MSGKFALIIGNTEYTDPGLAQLTAPGKDAEDFARVLKDTEIGAFDDVVTLLNQPEYVVREAIDDFFNQKMPDDLLVLYFSGHGVRDELGALYLAVKNTIRSKLRATGIKSDYIREAMDQSRSRRQVLVLDCCNSGAFAQGTKAEIGGSVGTKTAFEGGYGRVILTASDSTQFAWEGGKVIGETDNSLFTHYLVEGLEGEADLDGDGHITVDELYDYAYTKVKFATPKQTPSKFSTKQQGEIVLRQNIRVENIKPVALPDDLLDEIDDTRPYVREAAVQKLEKILSGRYIALAYSAREALERIAEMDDSRSVSRAAMRALEAIRPAETLAVHEEKQGRKTRKQEVERIEIRQVKARLLGKEKSTAARHKVEEVTRSTESKSTDKRLKAEERGSERSAIKLPQETTKQKSENLPEQAVIHARAQPKWVSGAWIAIGWGIAGFIGWAMRDMIGETLQNTVVGAIGGLVMAIILSNEYLLKRSSEPLITLGWAIGGAFIGGLATAIILYSENVLTNRKSVIWTTLGWAVSGIISGIIFFVIVMNPQPPDFLLSLLDWGIADAISRAVGGFVMIWLINIDQINLSKEMTESFSRHNISYDKTKKYADLMWKKRAGLGAMIGIVLGLIASASYGDISIFFLLFIVCTSVGLITYPTKTSFILLVIGFIVLGSMAARSFLDFVSFGAVFGLSIGALISRILFWIGALK